MASRAARLILKDVHVGIAGKEIVKGVSLELQQGEVHALMGPNGSGKSTLAYALMGHPRYEVTGGKVTIGRRNLLEMGPDERAKAGLFLAFQYPMEIPGVPVANFLRQAYASLKGKEPSVFEFYELLQKKMRELGIPEDFARRYLNEGFSGGEKKKHEILQLAVLQPRFAILDETDSGLDIDALRTVAEGVNRYRHKMGVLVITHYHRLLQYLTPDRVHVFYQGRIVESGGRELALQLETQGYDWVREKYGAQEPALVGG